MDLKCPICAKSLSTGGQLVTTKCGCRIMHKDCFRLNNFYNCRRCPAPNCQKWLFKNEVFNVFMDRRNPEEVPKKIPRLSSTSPQPSPRPNILGLPQGNRALGVEWRWDIDAASKLVVPTREPICGHKKCTNSQKSSLKTCDKYKRLVKKFSRQENRIRKALEEKANYERELRLVPGNGGRGDQEVDEGNEEIDAEIVGEDGDADNQDSVEEEAGGSDGDEADY